MIDAFADPAAFPALASLDAELRGRWQELRAEGIANITGFSTSPEVYIQNQHDIRLFILPMKWQGRMVSVASFNDADHRGYSWRPRLSGEETEAAAPVLAGICQNPVIVSAMYSAMMPGAELFPHTDRVEAIGDVYRLHLGLACPGEGCSLTVNGETRDWRDGQTWLFDSARVEHSARNATEQPRLILIVDVAPHAVTG